ncbi:MAG: hypothetical protein WCW84_07720 [Sulfurimonas sp.]|jgi:hypothetical protein
MLEHSICIASNRSLIQSKASLSSAIGYVELTNSELIISDNSSEISKEIWCKNKISNKVKYLTLPGSNSRENNLNAYSNATGEYISWLHDDDFLVKLDPTFSMQKTADKRCVGFRPSVALWDEHTGISKSTNFSIIGNTAKERVKEYFCLNGGNNTTFFSFMKREIILNITDLYTNSHPTIGTYCDWAVVLAYISSGNILHNPSSLYIYNNHNWSGDAAKIHAAIEKQFTDVGLQSRSQLFLPLLTGLDSFILICRETSPIARDEIYEAGIEALVMYLKSFLARYGQNKTLFTPNEQKTIEEMAVAVGIKNILNAALKVIDVHAPEIVEKYKLFYRVSIGCEWGDFR